MQATSSLARPLQSAAPVSSAQPKSSARKATSCTNIGLLRAQSPWLRKEDIRIALFKENSVVSFMGRLQLRVLAGLVHCFGHVYKPSASWHEVVVPLSQDHPPVTFTALSPALKDPELSSYLEPFRSRKGLHFHSSSAATETIQCSDSEGCVVLDLEGKDLYQMNKLSKSEWGKMVAIVLIRSLATPFTQLLGSLIPSAMHVQSQWTEGLRIVDSSVAFEVPKSYMTIAWDLAQVKGPSVLMCGPVDTGKSTLCCYLTNYLLNLVPVICYVDCDVGQAEFTVSGVVSLHLLTEPILGPPMTHQREPAKAYYFGACSPSNYPEHYYKALRGLQRHLAKVVRPAHPNIPVIINTCGWVKDMGLSLLLDIIRMFRPSHIVQLLDKYVGHSCLLTSSLLSEFSGVYTRPETSGGGALTMGYAAAQEAVARGSNNSLGTKEQLPMDVDSDSGSQLSSTSDEEHTREQSPDSSSGSEDERKLTDDAPPMMTIGCRQHGKKGKRGPIDSWSSLCSHRLFLTFGRTVARKGSTSKALLRQLATLSHFSRLLGQAEAVAREQGIAGEIHSDFLFLAPPLEIPWSDVAIHVVNCPVPRSQVLYALIGRIIALGQAHQKEIVSCEVDSTEGGVVKFLKSNDPLIEFLGLGLVRAIDMVQQRFYVTTPLSLTPEVLDRINVLAVGQVDILPSLLNNTAATQNSPY